MTDTKAATKIEEVDRNTPVARIQELVEESGGVIIRELFTKDQVRRFNEDVDPMVEALQPGPPNPVDIGGYDGFHGADTKRLTNLVTHSVTFRNEMLQDPFILEIADEFLLPIADSYTMSAAQVIEIGPGNAAQPLHRDLVNWPIFHELGPAGYNVTINFLVALTDFTEENGATRVIPGSNHWESYDDTGRPEDTIPALLSEGDALFISGKVAHGGGENKTTDSYRRALAWTFTIAWLCGEEAHPFVIPIDIVRTLPPKIQQLLGFRSYYNASKGGGSLWQVNYEELARHLDLE